MSHCTAFDSVLASLARPFSRKADTLLDLREWAGDERRVGSYVRAYFDLREEAAGGEAARGLADFRTWLETHLEIVVVDGTSSELLETWPVALAGESDLEGYCRKAMDRLRDDRCHPAAKIYLQFRFRERFAEAA